MYVYFVFIDLSPPIIDQKKNDTQNIAEGDENAIVSCSVITDPKQALEFAICYAPLGEGFNELIQNTTSNCILCHGQSSGYCHTDDSSIVSRPRWKVRAQIQYPYDCFKKVTTTLVIPKVTAADNNSIIYCTLKSRFTRTQPQVYAQYNMKVQPAVLKAPVHRNWKQFYSLLAIPLGTLFVVVVVVIIVIRHRRTCTRLRCPGTLVESTRNSRRNTSKLEYLLSLYTIM